MRGQATLEYLMIFSVMVLLGIGLVKVSQTTFGGTVGLLGQELSDYLSVGVCPRLCFSDGYANKPEE